MKKQTQKSRCCYTSWKEKHSETGTKNDMELLSSNRSIKLSHMEQGIKQNRRRYKDFV
jgi:hypothetical protein